ncbi:MAG: hypothetical protein FJ095_01315 [Deltaproteobacteria bacterium]|nr:hypothetical protein [Deltaproteobacteria bacterium]
MFERARAFVTSRALRAFKTATISSRTWRFIGGRETPCFPCAFDTLVAALVHECQASTGCVTNGELQVSLADDGCVGSLSMTRPNDVFVACLAEGFDAARCPCDDSPTVELFQGLGNLGCDG